MNKALNVTLNSFLFFIQLLLAGYYFYLGDYLMVLMLVVMAIDNLEDVYYYVSGKGVFTGPLTFLDVVLEAGSFMFSLAVMALSLLIMVYTMPLPYLMMAFMGFLSAVSCIADLHQRREKITATTLSLNALEGGGKFLERES